MMDVGDKVIIRIKRHTPFRTLTSITGTRVGICRHAICTGVTDQMKQYDGQEATVVSSDTQGRYKLDVDGRKFGWTDCMLEPMKVPCTTRTISPDGASLTLERMMKDLEKAFEVPKFDFPRFEVMDPLPHSWYCLGREPNFTSSLRKPMDTLKKMTDTLKRFIKGPFRSFYQLGWVDQDLDLTEKGGRELTLFLFEHFEKEFGEYAAKRVAELKKKEQEEESDEDDE